MARSVKPWVGKHDDHMPTTKVKLRVAARHGNACPNCHRPLSEVKGTACDHIIPLADGGENAEGNLQILCTDCHGAKTSAENTQRARERSQKAKSFGMRKEPHPRFKRPPGFRYDWSKGSGRLVKDDAR